MAALLEQEVRLDIATASDAALLANLLELYVHDMSEVFPDIELGPDGRFGYQRLPLYWSEPGRRFAFLIRYRERLAGFALATRGSPVSEDPDVLDIAEFFVLRGLRRTGVGRSAARLLWQRLPGHWVVRVAEGNVGAVRFWTGIIGEYTAGRVTRSDRARTPNAFRVFDFESTPGGYSP